MKKIVTIAILGSLVLLGGCGDQLPTDIPDVLGYQGYIQLGWDSYNDENFQTALDYFLDAIDMDPSKPEAFVGAGWASLYLPDYWRIADEYFYMAIQHQIGYYPLAGYSESQVQDTMWTNFECLHPDLPGSVLNPILQQTADSGIVWVGDQIYAIVGPGNDIPMPFRFQPLNSGVMTMFVAVNSYTTLGADVDSIAGGWVYLNVPLAEMDIGGDTYYTWISVDEQVNYDYRVFLQTATATGQLFYDALAGCCMLQDIRGENGDALLGCVAAWALDNLNTDYTFGYGQIYEGYEVVSNLQLKGTAAALAFANQYFRFAWFTCTSEGLGTGLNPGDPGFVTGLMAVIETMLNS
ncbi:MAG: hypothetical protein GQ565_00270 [Candidatus Aegiribacteria sp.]|nr:hypothetical protein [Candidatus Aegiribacteria sp.]